MSNQNASRQTVTSSYALSTIEEIISLLKPDLEKMKIQLTVDIPETYILPADSDLIKQVIMNLMLNSLEAVQPSDSIRIEYRSKNMKDRDFQGIVIKDTGAGIEEKYLDKIFEPFFTTKKDAESKGIGLSLCREIMNQLGGIIEVKSEKGSGSEFSLLFPLSPEEKR